jgi:hypothetical protein
MAPITALERASIELENGIYLEKIPTVPNIAIEQTSAARLLPLLLFTLFTLRHLRKTFIFIIFYHIGGAKAIEKRFFQNKKQPTKSFDRSAEYQAPSL